MSSELNSMSSDIRHSEESIKHREEKLHEEEISGEGLRDRSSTWSNGNKLRRQNITDDNNQQAQIRERFNSYIGKRDSKQN